MNNEGSSPNKPRSLKNNQRPNRDNANEVRMIMETRPREKDDSQDRAMVTYTREDGRSDERTTLSSAQRQRKRTPCYSRTCPVIISHPSSREKMVGLAIIDDQAGRPILTHSSPATSICAQKCKRSLRMEPSRSKENRGLGHAILSQDFASPP